VRKSDKVCIGIDAVSVSRCREKLERNPGMYQRVLGQGEEIARSPREFARMFAIKEACIKSSGGAVSFRDVSVSRGGSGMPRVTWCAVEDLEFKVSVTCELDMVVAVSLCCKTTAEDSGSC
jgi:hypothetical protein